MKYRVNVDIGIDMPSGKHEALGSTVELDEKAAAANVKRGWLVPIAPPPPSATEPLKHEEVKE